MVWKIKTNQFLFTMSLFTKILNVFKPTPKLGKKQMNKIIHEAINKNQSLLKRLGDDMDYDGMGNYGRFPPIIGDDYPTYEQVIKEYESQNSK